MGGFDAEVLEGVVFGIARLAEGGDQRAVLPLDHVDARSLVDVRVAVVALTLLLGILHEGEVILLVVGDDAIEVGAQWHAARLAGDQFEIDSQFGVGVQVCDFRLVHLP